MLYKMLYKSASKQTKEGQTNNDKSQIRQFCTSAKGVKAKARRKTKGIKQGLVDFVVIPN